MWPHKSFCFSHTHTLSNVTHPRCIHACLPLWQVLWKNNSFFSFLFQLRLIKNPVRNHVQTAGAFYFQTENICIISCLLSIYYLILSSYYQEQLRSHFSFTNSNAWPAIPQGRVLPWQQLPCRSHDLCPCFHWLWHKNRWTQLDKLIKRQGAKQPHLCADWIF